MKHLRKFSDVIISSLAVIVSMFRLGLHRLVGDLSWNPPTWMRVSFAAVCRRALGVADRYTIFYRENRRVFIRLHAVLAIVLSGSIGGYLWYRSLPQPHQLTYGVTAPLATPLLPEDAKPFPLVVTFDGSAAKLDAAAKVVESGIITSPPIRGIWRWRNDAVLEFNPESDWPVGEKIEVSFANELFPRHVRLATYSFEFSTPALVPSLTHAEFYEDPTDPKVKQAVYTVSFTHSVDKSDFEKHIALRLRVEPVKSFEDSDARNLAYRVSYNPRATQAYIRSEILSIPIRDGEALLTVESGIHSARGGHGSEAKLSRTVQIPGIENYARVVGIQPVNVSNPKSGEAEQLLTVETSAPISISELSKGVKVLTISPSDIAKIVGQSRPGEIASGEEEEDEGESEEDSDSENGDPSYVAPPPCPWGAAGALPEGARPFIKPVSAQWLPGEGEWSKLSRFRYEAEPGSCLIVEVTKGTKFAGDFALASDRALVTRVPPFSADVRLISKGALLSLSGDKKISIVAHSQKAVQFRLSRVLPRSVHLLVSQSWEQSPFEQPDFAGYFTSEDISEVFTTVTNLPHVRPGLSQYSHFDFSSYLNSSENVPRGLFMLEAVGYDPDAKRNVGSRDRRLVVVTDLALLTKDNQDKTHDVYVQSIKSGDPVEGAEVSILGKNGVALFSAKTDLNGRVHFPTFKDFKRERAPLVYVVTKESDFSFLPFERWGGRTLNYSRFDSGGLYTTSVGESLQASLFSDRGIYRPGETANLGMIVKSLNWGGLEPGVPFELRISDPRGREIQRRTVRFEADGFEEVQFAVAPEALTGSYEAALYLARPNARPLGLGVTTIRVDEFLPDQLKVNANLSASSSAGWITPTGLKGTVSVRNLFGTVAAGNRVRGSIRLVPWALNFRPYGDYQFFDPHRPRNQVSETVAEQEVGADGTTSFDFNLSRFEAGSYRLTFLAEAFEKASGRSVSATTSAIVSPFAYLVGMKAQGDLRFIAHGAPRAVHIVAINPELSRIGVDGLTTEVVEKRVLSVLTRQESGSLAYESVTKEIPKGSQPLSLSENGELVSLPTQDPGTFILRVRNKDGELLNSLEFFVAGEGSTSAKLEHEAELHIKLNKTDYAPGEEISVSIQAPYAGAGLLTIERDKVYASKWFKTTTTNSVQTITLPPELDGNGYVNVTFLRSVDSPEVYASPLSYSVEPFSVSRERHTHQLTMDLPDKVHPGETLEIGYRSEQPARVVLFAVDEGILQVARYQTPDPLGHFMRKRALEVGTSQILDLLLPEFRLLANASAPGGDEDAFLGRFTNPFKRRSTKPVAFWSGIVSSGPERQLFRAQVPDSFNGTLQVFAVSVNEGQIGVVQKSVVSQAALVLSPNAPLAAAPGDEFEVSTQVTNTALPSSPVEVSLEGDAHLEILSAAQQKVDLAPHSDAVVSFRVRVKDLLGASTLVFRATSGDTLVKYPLDISIRPPSQWRLQVNAGTIEGGLFGSRTQDVAFGRSVYPEFASRSLSVSFVPLGLAAGLNQFLEAFPHGCSEQITSQAFPGLILGSRPEFQITKEKVSQSVERAFALLGARQQSDGGFALWPGYPGSTGSNASEAWATLHAGHFLIEAQDRGYHPPHALVTETLGYLSKLGSGNDTEPYAVYHRAYALYLRTRAGIVTTNQLNALKEDLLRIRQDPQKQGLTTLFIAGSLRLLKLDTEAERLVSGFATSDIRTWSEIYEDRATEEGLALALLARHFPHALRSTGAELVSSLTTHLLGREYHTRSAALMILALDEYQKAQGVPNLGKVQVQSSRDGKDFFPLALPDGYFAQTSVPSDQQRVRLESDSKTPIYYQLSEGGYDRSLSTVPEAHTIEVMREYENEKGEVVTHAKLGEDLRVHLWVRRIDGGSNDLGLVALSDLLPSGFELSAGSAGLSMNLATRDRWVPSFVDAREDRALLYGPVTSDAQHYIYSIKAVTKGSFVVPPVQLDSMYDSHAFARGASTTFTIE